ncbi:MAG: hypothetical protein V9G29_03520 [Burkholderiaceae bacterium]
MRKAKVGDAPTTSGLVVSGFGRHYIVESASGERTICHPRGKKSLCVVGDRVRWQITGKQNEGRAISILLSGVARHIDGVR